MLKKPIYFTPGVVYVQVSLQVEFQSSSWKDARIKKKEKTLLYTIFYLGLVL